MVVLVGASLDSSTLGQTHLVLADARSIRQLQDSIVLHGHDGPCQSTALVRFSASCDIAWATGAEDIKGLRRQLMDITQRSWDLLTIVLKLDWLRKRRDAQDLDPMLWMIFAANDVNSFLMNVRSLFDHLAKMIRIVSGRQTPQSFSDLRRWVARDTHNPSQMLDPRLVNLVAECDWYDDLRDIRDDILHRAAHTIVFPELPYIGIQIRKGVADGLITEPALLDPENSSVVRFERFAVASLGRTHVLLEEAAHLVQELRAVPDRGTGARSCHVGLTVVYEWCDEFLGALHSDK